MLLRGCPPRLPAESGFGSPFADGLDIADGGFPATACSDSGGLGKGFDIAVAFTFFPQSLTTAVADALERSHG